MLLVLLLIIIAICVVKIINDKNYKELEADVLKELGFRNWNVALYFDASVTVKSRQTLEKYDDIKFFKENTRNS